MLHKFKVVRKQDEILERNSKKHNIPITIAKEISMLLFDKVVDVISDQKKTEDGLYDMENMKTIHFSRLGKFIPNNAKVQHINNSITANLKKKKDE